MNRSLSNPLPARSGPRAVLLVTLLTGWMISGTVNAAEAEQSATTSEPESEASSQPDQSDSDNAASSSEVFIPTEDISEDFAVSFPVDI